MKRMLAFLLAVTILLTLIGCQSGHSTDESAHTAETAPSGTAESLAVPTQPFTVPTSSEIDATDPYNSTPSEFPVRYDTVDWTADTGQWRTVNLPDNIPNSFPETISSRCEEGFLYIYNEKIGELRTIVKQVIIDTDRTTDHLYYILESEPGSVYRTDFEGKQHERICQIEGAQLEIDGLLYYQDQLSLAMIINGRQAAVYQIPKGKLTILMEQAFVQSFGFDYEEDSYRVMLCWHGRVLEDEEGTHPYKTYLDTGETVDWNYL